MKGRRSVFLSILVLVLVIGGAYALYGKLSQGMQPVGLAVEEGETSAGSASASQEEPSKVAAPDFTVVDGAGEEAALSDYLGRPVVLNFWASWCGPCKSEMPDFDDAWAEVGEEVSFLMVNVTDGSRETFENAKAYVEEQGFAFPVFYDTNLEAAMAYGVQSLPTTFFIDREGYLTAWAKGAISRETLEQGLALAQGEEA